MKARFVSLMIFGASVVGCSATIPRGPTTVVPTPLADLADDVVVGETQPRTGAAPDTSLADDVDMRLATIRDACARGDDPAVREERALIEERDDVALRLCLARALVTMGDVLGARTTLSTLVGEPGDFGSSARDLIATALERLGRWDEIVALYQDGQRVHQHRDRRHLGWALYRLEKWTDVERLVLEKKPREGDAWYWLWWLLTLEQGSASDAASLGRLVEGLKEAPDLSEVRQLKPLAIQAYRKVRWLEAASQCTARQNASENEMHALTMSRTAVAAAVRGDVSMWTVALTCAFKLAQSSSVPEDTCQEIHREQIDWSVFEKLREQTMVYPEFGACGEKSPDIRMWLKQWRGGESRGASS